MLQAASSDQPLGKSATREAVSADVKGARIQGHGVSKTFVTKDATVQALTPLDFTIKAGEFVSLIGPSGCGKSTLMLITAGLLEPTDGTVTVNGEQLTGPLTDVGIVFQDHLLLEFRNTIDNILLQAQIRGIPDEEGQQRAEQLLKQLGLEGAGKRYPNQLSGGMRQRVSLGRALIHDPSILFMDEPFGALDAITRTQMRYDLEQLWLAKKKSVLFITHSVEEAIGLSDRVLVMSSGPGRIIEEIEVDLARPRPIGIGQEKAFVEYADHVYAIFSEIGVLRL